MFYSLRSLAVGSLFERLIAQRQLRGDLFKDLRCKCCKLSSRHASGRGCKGLGNLLRDGIGQFRQAGDALGDGRGLPRGDLPSRAAFIGASWVLMERASFTSPSDGGGGDDVGGGPSGRYWDVGGTLTGRWLDADARP